MKQKKRKNEEQEWFNIDQKTNNNVYVTGLPESLTEENFVTLMSKCGIIMEDDTGCCFGFVILCRIIFINFFKECSLVHLCFKYFMCLLFINLCYFYFRCKEGEII